MVRAKKTVIVLGIHDGHNASACLVKDGQVIAALAEERCCNEKNYTGVPSIAIQKILKQTGIKPQDIDKVAISSLLRTGDPLERKNNFWMKGLETISPYFASHWFSKLFVFIFHSFRQNKELKQVLSEHKILAPINYVEHHLAHATSAYYQQPWGNKKTLILTLDGAGDGLSSTVNIGEKNQIKRIASSTHYDSLSNNLYSEITGFLGLKRWEHEYKIMGMAPYGQSKYVKDKLSEIIRLNPDNPFEFQNISGNYARSQQGHLRELLAEQRFDNISAATQEIFEELVVSWVKYAIKKTRIKRVATAGGSFLNVKTNEIIRGLKEVKESFFYPVADDAGTAIGAALHTYFNHCEHHNIKPQRHQLETLYLGVEYNSKEIHQTISRYSPNHSWKVVKPRNMARKVAKLLSQGQIVARFSGRDEFGPRALGNRTIMADPRSFNMVHKINFAIKQRDFWMPFAASVIEKDGAKYFKNFRPARYMIESFQTKPAAEEIIAGLHPKDLSGRPQTVNESNQEYLNILKEFKKLTKVSALMNTSFNLHGSPIVGTPKVALETFINSGLDSLILGPYLITKRH